MNTSKNIPFCWRHSNRLRNRRCHSLQWSNRNNVQSVSWPSLFSWWHWILGSLARCVSAQTWRAMKILCVLTWYDADRTKLPLEWTERVPDHRERIKLSVNNMSYELVLSKEGERAPLPQTDDENVTTSNWSRMAVRYQPLDMVSDACWTITAMCRKRTGSLNPSDRKRLADRTRRVQWRIRHGWVWRWRTGAQCVWRELEITVGGSFLVVTNRLPWLDPCDHCA